jgi:hypothetical protein
VTFEIDGFLSDDLEHKFSTIPECASWFRLARNLNRVGHRFAFEEKLLEIEGRGLTDVKALTMLLFFRALSNFQGSIVPAARGLIVESRTLARSLGESVLCMVGAKLDPDHLKSLVNDELKSRRARSRLLLRMTDHLRDGQAEVLRQLMPRSRHCLDTSQKSLMER